MANFDIANMKKKIDKTIQFNNSKIEKLQSQYPMYLALSIYFFQSIVELDYIIYENIDDIGIIRRKDVSNHI